MLQAKLFQSEKGVSSLGYIFAFDKLLLTQIALYKQVYILDRIYGCILRERWTQNPPKPRAAGSKGINRIYKDVCSWLSRI